MAATVNKCKRERGKFCMQREERNNYRLELSATINLLDSISSLPYVWGDCYDNV